MAGQGSIFTTSDTVTVMRSLRDFVDITDPQDTPCVSLLGLNNADRFKIRDMPNHKYAWLLDTIQTRTATLAEAMDTTETGMDVTAGQGIRFKPGDVWRSVETGELLWVDSRSTDTITVVRNWTGAMGGSQGTATVGITNATTLEFLFSARLEGDDSDAAHFTTPTEEYNYSQIFHHEIRVTGSEADATRRYGISDYYKYQFQKAMGGLGGSKDSKGRKGFLQIQLEQTFFYGRRVQRTETVAGGMGGMKQFVTSNVYDLAGALLEYDNLNTAIQDCWEAGGKPDYIVCNAFNKQLINSWYTPQVRTERTEQVGGVKINRIDTDFGELKIVMNRWCPTNEVYIFQSDYVGWVTHRDWREEKLAKDGDYSKTQLLGEFGFVCRNEDNHAVITDTATSA